MTDAKSKTQKSEFEMELDAIAQNGFMAHLPSKQKPSVEITEEELAAVNKKAYLTALEGFLKTCYQREMVRGFMDSGKLPYTPKDEGLLKMLNDQAKAVTTKPPFMLVTVNPRPGTKYEDLKKPMEKFLRSKSISQYFYVYETTDTGHIHSHVLLKYDIKPYDFKRSAKNTFKGICDTSNPHCLNFKFIDDETLPQKVDYLLGQKTDTKMKGVGITKKWRTENNIPAFIESSPPLPCRATQKAILCQPNLSAETTAPTVEMIE